MKPDAYVRKHSSEILLTVCFLVTLHKWIKGNTEESILPISSHLTVAGKNNNNMYDTYNERKKTNQDDKRSVGERKSLPKPSS